jgi:isoquinoline 1-oxidoreductase alpha subunit
MEGRAMTIDIRINGSVKQVDVPSDTPLLWVVREELSLKGTKFGCGMGLCGACTVHLDGVAIRSCITPIAAVGSSEVTTIEGLPQTPAARMTEGELHPVQEAWVANSVPQCGYCQSGQIMAAASLLNEKPQPTPDEIRAHMSGNICRCGTYPAIQRAIVQAAERLGAPEKEVVP